MAEAIDEKHTTPDTAGIGKPSQSTEHSILEDDAIRPKGKPWMYKATRLGAIKIPAYATPPFQLVLVAFVCFLCPGMFNAVNGLGAAGQVSPRDINKANTAVYSTFSVVGFFAGSIANRIGLRMTLGFGGFGYFLYIASILSYNHNKNAGFLIFAGALLGVCAGMLWAAQGAVMMSYPPEKSKGKYISWFWMIFNLGAVVGSLIPLGLNLHSEGGAVSDGTYIAFMVLMALGFFLAFSLADPKHVQRSDGSHIIVMKNPTWKSEIFGLFEVLKTDWYIICLVPLFFSSNYFYTYQFQDVNAVYFNIRTRALNNTLYWLCQIIGAYLMGYALDINIRRTIRAKGLWVFLLVLTMAVWGGGYAFQNGYTREEVTADNYTPVDFVDSGYVGPMFLYMFYGLYDAMWQTAVYWLMGSLTNNGRKLANFAGFYKGIQSAGAAVAPSVDNTEGPYMTNLATAWGLLAGSLIIAAPVIFFKVKETISLEEDLKFSDETFAEVAPTEARVARQGENPSNQSHS